jgi:hypothetical protein
VTHDQVRQFGVVNADFESVSARRVQETIAHHCPDRIGRHHRLADEAVDDTEDESLIDVSTRHNCQCCLDRKMSDKHGKAVEHDALQFGQEPVTPIQRGL